MGKDLKAENLTICVPNKGCNKNCPYCVSRMTGYVDADYDKMVRNIGKVKTVAKSAEVTSILFTGKGEPLLNPHQLMSLMAKFKEWPLELQTNGLALLKNENLIDQLYTAGLDTLAISVDDYKFLNTIQSRIDRANVLGLNVRITMNIINQDRFNPESMEDFFDGCRQNGVQQVTFRRVIAPPVPVDIKTAQWIEDNVDMGFYNDIKMEVTTLAHKKGRKIRTLNSGMEVWDVNGLSVLLSDYCIQDKDNGTDVRSLIFMEDGHLYTNWGSKASLLF